MEGKNDFANYRKLSQPFENPEQANAAISGFFQAIEEARKEWHITDAHIIIRVNVTSGDTEGPAMASAHFGNTLEAEAMCAWGLGQESAHRIAAVRELMKAV